MVKLVIIHYNTPHLTECLVRSINLFVKDAIIYIFDNSDKLPFTAKFDNVKIIDNTKGQIINFDEWIKKYPDRTKTTAHKNNYGSAKHCYSVEKCMDIINDNFILLDSDILLKKDISDIIDEKCAFVSDTEYWRAKSSSAPIKCRAVPYLCFINVKMCKKNKIHYFDKDHIFGLTKNGNSYDTGAYFMERVKAKNLKWKKISYNNYIIHYKGGSWVEGARKYDHYNRIDASEWLKINNKYWNVKMSKNKKVVYTCITGGYDGLIEPSYISDGFDYVCFTDNKALKSDVWKIRPLPKETEGLSQVKKQRFVKINAHLLLKEYDISIWVDGNVTLKGNLNEFVSETIKDRVSIYVPKHPQRNCIYSEAKAVLSMKKDKPEIVNKQLERYKKEGFPVNFGLLQSNIMLRRHNNPECIKLMEAWWNELKGNSHRDQLSFNYVLWKNNNIKVAYMDKFIYKSKWFLWKGFHHSTIQTSKTNTTSTKKSTIDKLAQVKKEVKERLAENRRSNILETFNVGIYGL